MKPYTDLNGKANRSLFWGDKVSKKIKNLFKKSARKVDSVLEEGIDDEFDMTFEGLVKVN